MGLKAVVYSTPGTYTWTAPVGTKAVWGSIYGGGMGGSMTQTVGTHGNAGGGGGSGETCECRKIPMLSSLDLTIVVGAGGKGGINAPIVDPSQYGGTSSITTDAGAVFAVGGSKQPGSSGADGHAGGWGGGCGGGEGTSAALCHGNQEGIYWYGGNGGAYGGNNTTAPAPSGGAAGNTGRASNGTGVRPGGGGGNTRFGPGGNGGNDLGGGGPQQGGAGINPSSGGGGSASSSGATLAGVVGAAGRVIIFYADSP